MTDPNDSNLYARFPTLGMLAAGLVASGPSASSSALMLPSWPSGSYVQARPTTPIDTLNRPRSLIARCRIAPGRVESLRQRLREPVFTRHAPGVHNARFAILDDEHLLFTAVFDVRRDRVLAFLRVNAASIDEVLSHCEGYPPLAVTDPDVLDEYLGRHDVRVRLMFNAYIDPGEPQVRQAVALRRGFLELLRSVQQDPAGIREHFRSFLGGSRYRIATSPERHLGDFERGLPLPGHRTTAFTMVTKIKPGLLPRARLRAVLGVGNLDVNLRRNNPIDQMVTVHFARFGIFDRDRLLFVSIYDGGWEQYVQDFSTRIPKLMDMVWGNCEGWPEGGAADTNALRAFLERHTIPTDVFYSAYMDVTSKEIVAAYPLAKALRYFVRELPDDPEALHIRTDAFVAKYQALLS